MHNVKIYVVPIQWSNKELRRLYVSSHSPSSKERSEMKGEKVQGTHRFLFFLALQSGRLFIELGDGAVHFFGHLLALGLHLQDDLLSQLGIPPSAEQDEEGGKKPQSFSKQRLKSPGH